MKNQIRLQLPNNASNSLRITQISLPPGDAILFARVKNPGDAMHFGPVLK
jgi:hypothetical protein